MPVPPLHRRRLIPGDILLLSTGRQMSNGSYCVVYYGNIVQADLLKCLLQSEGIAALLQDEFVGMIAPYVSPGGAGAVKVLIAESDFDQARGIVDDFVNRREPKARRNFRLVK